MITTDTVTDFEARFGPTSRAVSRLIRPQIVAPEGYKLVWGDWSAIEARVLPWLANTKAADRVLDIFRTNDADPSLPDIYRVEAGGIYDKPATDVDKGERQVGKVSVLALGFGGGAGALTAMATGYGLHLEEDFKAMVVSRWRQNNQWAVDFWAELMRAFQKAWDNPGEIQSAGRVSYVFLPSILRGCMFCYLPDGRAITYPALRREIVKYEDEETGEEVREVKIRYTSGYERKSLWHGTLCLEGGTDVLTDRGWVQLTDVQLSDRLWDGVEWVRHGGLSFNGYDLTMPVDGVMMTRGHEVMTDDGWKAAQDCKRFGRPSVRLPDGRVTRTSGWSRQERTVVGEVRVRLARLVRQLGLAAGQPASIAKILRLHDWRSDRQQHMHPRDDVAPRLRGVAVHARPLQAALASGVAQLRWAGHLCLHTLADFRGFLAGHGAFVPTRSHAGADRQRGRLHTRELLLGDPRGAGEEPAQLTARGHPGGAADDGAGGEHAAVPMGARPVYDIVNAGPRSRFVVRGDAGPLIVHNCENVTQGTAGSLLRHTLVDLEKRDWSWAETILHTHDEIGQLVPERHADEAEIRLKLAMETLPKWAEGLPMVAETTQNDYYTKVGD